MFVHREQSVCLQNAKNHRIRSMQDLLTVLYLLAIISFVL